MTPRFILDPSRSRTSSFDSFAPKLSVTTSGTFSRSIMAKRLSELCRDLLCQTDDSLLSHEKLLLFPMSSTGERILVSSPRELPFSMANQLIEDLAKRGKLTSNILRVLMTSTITRLNLTCLRSIDDEPTFTSQLAKQGHVVDVDLSFSPCLGKLSIPFVSSLAQSCRNTLLSFSASSVGGYVGIEYLRDFSRLCHLDVSFSSTSCDVIRDLCANLTELTYLDVSGTDLSWPKVFDFASNLTHLKHLGMSHLWFLTDDEQMIFFEPVFRPDWVKSFFNRVQTLTSLDVSSVICVDIESSDIRRRSDVEHIESALTLTMDEVLANAPKSLTRLATSWWFSDRVSAELDTGKYSFEVVLFIADHRIGSTLLFREIISHWEESISLHSVILDEYLAIEQPLTRAQLEMILSKGLELLNRKDSLCALSTVCRSIVRLRSLSSGLIFRRLFEETVFLFRCHFMKDVRTYSSVHQYVSRILAVVSVIEGREHWNEVQPLYEIVLESLFEPSFYDLKADGVSVKEEFTNRLIWHVVQNVMVPSKLSLAHSAAVFILTLFDRCRLYPQYRFIDRSYVTYAGNNARKILEAFFDFLTDKQRQDFVLINNFTEIFSKRILDVISEASEYYMKRRTDWEFVDNELSHRFAVLRLISSRISPIQRSIVDSGAVSSDVQVWVFDLMWPECPQSEAYSRLMALLISLAENSILRSSLISIQLVRCLCQSNKEFTRCITLQKSYLACLLLLSESASLGEAVDGVSRLAVHFPANVCKSELLSFSIESLKEMSQFSRQRVAEFGKKCLAVLKQ